MHVQIQPGLDAESASTGACSGSGHVDLLRVDVAGWAVVTNVCAPLVVELVRDGDEAAAEAGGVCPEQLRQVARVAARHGVHATVELETLLLEQRQLCPEPLVERLCRPVPPAVAPDVGVVLAYREPRHVAALVVPSDTLVGPALRHLGQLWVPAQVGQRPGRRQVSVSVLAGPYRPPDRVMAGDNLGLLCGGDAVAVDGAAGGGGAAHRVPLQRVRLVVGTVVVAAGVGG